MRHRSRRRQVLFAGELSDAEIAAIQKARVPSEFSYLDDELKGWGPNDAVPNASGQSKLRRKPEL
jgi:hypothetical protein